MSNSGDDIAFVALELLAQRATARKNLECTLHVLGGAGMSHTKAIAAWVPNLGVDADWQVEKAFVELVCVGCLAHGVKMAAAGTVPQPKRIEYLDVWNTREPSS